MAEMISAGDFRNGVTIVTTYCTYKFFHNDNLLFLINFFYNLRLSNAVTAFPIKQSGT